jgi:hypothetical protein
MFTEDIAGIIDAVDSFYDGYPEYRDWPIMGVIYHIGKNILEEEQD